MNCKNCGQCSIADGSTFCPRCGAKLPVPVVNDPVQELKAEIAQEQAAIDTERDHLAALEAGLVV